MLKLHLPNRPSIIEIVLQEGDTVGLETPHPGAWLLTFHGIRDGIPTHFVFEGGDNKRLLDAHTLAQAVDETEQLFENTKFKLGRSKVSKGLWYFPLGRN